MTRVENALTRLEQAVARLEQAGRHAADNKDAPNGESAPIVRAADAVSARLDAVIGRIDRVLEG